VRVVADLGTFLAAVQRFDGGVEVQHPRPIQGLPHAAHQRAAHPRLAGLGHIEKNGDDTGSTAVFRIIGGEPLLNNAALVELLWGLKLAGTRFSAAAGM
jgi:hypothetical protein